MGSDDDQDCPEHIWVLVGMTCDMDGTHNEYRCQRCETLMVVGPDEMSGVWDRQDAMDSRSDTGRGA